MDIIKFVRPENLPSFESRRKMIPFIADMYELVHIAFHGGIVSTEKAAMAKVVPSSEAVNQIYQKAFTWALQGEEPEIIQENCCVLLISGTWVPEEYLAIILIAKSIYGLQSQVHPNRYVEQLLCWIGLENEEELNQEILIKEEIIAQQLLKQFDTLRGEIRASIYEDYEQYHVEF